MSLHKALNLDNWDNKISQDGWKIKWINVYKPLGRTQVLAFIIDQEIVINFHLGFPILLQNKILGSRFLPTPINAKYF